MKKLNRLTALAVALAVCFSACKEDEIVESGDPSTGTTEIPEDFSSYTSEQNKANLEDNGIELIHEMDALQEAPGTQASASFAYWMGQSSEAPANGRILNAARTLQKYQDGSATVKDVFATLRTQADEPSSIQEYYDKYTGIYSWNHGTEKWDYNSEGDKIVFEFPSTESGTANDAVLTIHSYEGIASPNPLGDDYEGDLPTKFVSELKVEGKQALVYNFNAAYNEDGTPTSVKTSLSISNYTFAFEAKNDSENVGSAYSLTKGDKILISMGAGAKGTFTTENIEKISASEDANPGDLATEANAFFQVMDIKIAGNVDIVPLADGMEEIYGDDAVMEGDVEEENYSEQAVKEAKLLNETVNLVVFYASKKQKIADSEFYTYEETYTYDNYYYNEDTQTWEVEEVEESYTSVNMRFIFADETKSDMETYFGEGFDELSSELAKFLRSLEG
ncbi:hypothetical protein OKW21_001285 [Catalinimonas alkaloidigena]|uniref:hypothetical protein n=1 Tax=Catalinimonas alkaloidigena TaxID=1075417 RepID=UPI00240754A8|nr:hypothetical protein [Catalinimonas alkaloidigena]MDF9796022.1 hypothetical protein [Catalinimonas alkaloidigena]